MKKFFPIILAGSFFFQPLFAFADVESKTNPTDVNDHTPEFSAIYNDQNGGDYATWYRIQVSTSSLGHWAHAKWDSGTSTMATTTESTRSPQISYAGSLLASSTTHYWRIRFSDDDRKEGAWSTATSTFYIDTSCNCATTTVYYIHTDHLSGSNAITNDSGGLVQTLDYYPFGSIRVNKIRADGLDEKRKFTGYEYDYSTGLNYAGARYQNPAQGRFVSQDPVFLAAGTQTDQKQLEQYLSDPQKHNSYSYARNNPLVYTDPNGQNPLLYLFVVATPYLYATAQDLPQSAADLEDLRQVFSNPNSSNVSRTLSVVGTYAGIVGPGSGYGRALNRSYDLFQAGRAASRYNWGRADTLIEHVEKHGHEFGINDVREYARRASEFFESSQASRLPTKVDEHGVIRTYDESTNTFGAYNPDRSTRTFFKPDDGPAYFERQKGKLVE